MGQTDIRSLSQPIPTHNSRINPTKASRIAGTPNIGPTGVNSDTASRSSAAPSKIAAAISLRRRNSLFFPSLTFRSAAGDPGTGSPPVAGPASAGARAANPPAAAASAGFTCGGK